MNLRTARNLTRRTADEAAALKSAVVALDAANRELLVHAGTVCRVAERPTATVWRVVFENDFGAVLATAHVHRAQLLPLLFTLQAERPERIPDLFCNPADDI